MKIFETKDIQKSQFNVLTCIILSNYKITVSNTVYSIKTREEEKISKMRDQRIRLTSFSLPPLPKEIFIKYGKYKKLKHWANLGFYGTHSIKETVEFIERKVKEEEEKKERHG